MTTQSILISRPRRSALWLTVLLGIALAVGACSPSGGLGPVPIAEPTPTADPTDGGPDLTPAPSGDPGSPAPSVPGASPSNGPSSGPTGSPTVETIVVRTYGVLPGDVGVEGLVPTLQGIPATEGVARAAMEQLLAGNLVDGISSAIPEGTRLLDLTVKDRVATVDLSGEFETGGGSASSFYRLGQVVYTLTQFPTVGAVLFQVDGRTVTTFGPEGIVLDGPRSRADFEDQLPSIFVDRPAYEAALGNPARIVGDSNVFEATFMITILDGEGRTVYEHNAMATCGTGCRGTFDVSAPYSISQAQWGTLRVWVSSARDGTPEDIRDYPVWLTPAT